MIYNIIKNR